MVTATTTYKKDQHKAMTATHTEANNNNKPSAGQNSGTLCARTGGKP